MFKLFKLGLVMVCLYGCQIIEEGEIDYVRTIADQGLNARNMATCNQELYNKSEFARAGVTRECYETLYRKYTKVPQIAAGETISVHLMQAFNGIAFESKNFSETFGNRGSNAEIVIIANVCEQGKSGCSMAFGPKSDKKGRVIFYSNGVKALQYLNFSFLPVYGPIEYEGGPLVIQISIIELDDPSDQQKAMLKSLASAGQQMYPPASNVLTVLDSVGSAILSNSADDILFRYSMTLVPDSNSNNYQSPIVAEGNYAFVRKNTSKGPLEQEIFDKLMFDNLSGRLVEECSDKENIKTIKQNQDGSSSEHDYIPCTLDLTTGRMFKDYRSNTYLTFQIKSGFVPKTLDNLQTFEMLLNDINQAADESALGAIDAIESLQLKFSSKAANNTLLKSLNALDITLAKVPRDEFDLFSVQAFELTEHYENELNKLKLENCYTDTATDKCKALITKEQLTSFQLKLRTLLKSINPNPAKPINDMIPTGITPLSTKSEVTAELENGYKAFYNKSIFASYMAELEVIKNMTVNITELRKSDTNSKYIEQRTRLLVEQVKKFLGNLLDGVEFRNQLSCSAITETSCYLYTDAKQTLLLAKMFNTYASKFGVTSNKLDLTSDSSLATSLSLEKIDSIVDDIAKHLNAIDKRTTNVNQS